MDSKVNARDFDIKTGGGIMALECENKKPCTFGERL